MTDGENWHQATSNHNKSNYHSFGYAVKGRLGTTYTNSALVAQMNTKTLAACQNAKAAGINVYTVAFRLDDATTRAMLTSLRVERGGGLCSQRRHGADLRRSNQLRARFPSSASPVDGPTYPTRPVAGAHVNNNRAAARFVRGDRAKPRDDSTCRCPASCWRVGEKPGASKAVLELRRRIGQHSQPIAMRPERDRCPSERLAWLRNVDPGLEPRTIAACA